MSDEPTLPPMNADLLEILGRPCFRCAGIANMLRKSGVDIPRKAEAEQGYTIHFLLGHYLADPVSWKDKAGAALVAMASLPTNHAGRGE